PPTPTPPYPLSLHDALPISISPSLNDRPQGLKLLAEVFLMGVDLASNGIALCACFIPGCRIVSFGLILRLGFRKGIVQGPFFGEDRKSTRLNSSHVKISYAV